MRRRTTSLAVASLAAGSLFMLRSATASAQDHTQAAIDFVNTAIVNDWADEPAPCWINWSTRPVSGATRGACFFTLVLKRVRGYQDRDLQAMWGSSSPDSSTLFDYIDASPRLNDTASVVETYFRKVTKAVDIRRGDILSVAATDTLYGHTVIITGPAVLIEPAVMPIYSGTKQYAVPIVDSSSISHGCNASYPDSRWRGPCTGGYMDPGAGTAYMRLYTDSLSGALLGFTWSVTASTSSYYSPNARPYRVGRLYKLPLASAD
jgi:hypothetical protein